MVFPNCGRVLVIDDNITEAMPLINLMSKKGVPIMYYSGNVVELPESPVYSVRLVFCDLKFNAASDAKSVVSNVVGILGKLLPPDNGPYILLVWSTHEVDYLEQLKTALKNSSFNPEFILQCSKSDYFFTKDNGAEFVAQLHRDIQKIGLDSHEEEKVMRTIELHAGQFLSASLMPNVDALQKIEEKLFDELKKANLFHLFVLWENTINYSALQTVNCIYKEVPKEIPCDKTLNAMLFYLCRYRLEQQLGVAEASQKLFAALSTLNEMFSYFCEDNIQAIKVDNIGIEDIVKSEEIKKLSDACFNRWVWTSPSPSPLAPGNVYTDERRQFEFHGWLFPNLNKEGASKENQEKAIKEYETILRDLSGNANIQYIFVDISADCDYAQRKQFVTKIIPGIMILASDLEKYKAESKLKNKEPEYIFITPAIEYEGREWVFVFNINQLCSINIARTAAAKLLFALSRPNLTAIKQRAASCIAKQGIAYFK